MASDAEKYRYYGSSRSKKSVLSPSVGILFHDLQSCNIFHVNKNKAVRLFSFYCNKFTIFDSQMQVIEVTAPLPSILQTQEEAKKINIH